jgi:hypothetical protein
VDLSINGGPRVAFTNSNSTPDAVNWEQFSTPFLATGTSTTLDFFNGQTTNNYTGLDNVVVSIVPEPNALALTALGLLALQVCRRFRHQRLPG